MLSGYFVLFGKELVNQTRDKTMDLKFAILEDAEVIKDLLDQIFGFDKITLATVKWLEQNPLGKNIWFTAFDKARPIGLYGMLPKEIKIENDKYPAFLCNNVGVIPEYRGKGVFVELGKFATDSCKGILFGVPNDSALPGHIKVGWDKLGTLELLHGRSSNLNLSGHTWSFDESNHFKIGLSRSSTVFGFEHSAREMLWRYSKPGVKYCQTHLGDQYVIWKEYKDVKQVMECNPFVAPYMLLDDDQDFELWSLADTMQNRIFKQMGFVSRMERTLIIKNYRGRLNPDFFRFELCDSDNF